MCYSPPGEWKPPEISHWQTNEGQSLLKHTAAPSNTDITAPLETCSRMWYCQQLSVSFVTPVMVYMVCVCMHLCGCVHFEFNKQMITIRKRCVYAETMPKLHLSRVTVWSVCFFFFFLVVFVHMVCRDIFSLIIKPTLQLSLTILQLFQVFDKYRIAEMQHFIPLVVYLFIFIILK